jgi:anti-sigma factor RsiW
MTGATTPIAEDDIHAYVDGELPPMRRAEVAFALKSDPEALARAEHYRFQKEGLRALYDGMLSEMPSDRLRQVLYDGKESKPTPAPLRTKPVEVWDKHEGPSAMPTDPGKARRDSENRMRGDSWLRYAAVAASAVLLAGAAAVGGWIGHAQYSQSMFAEAQMQSFINQAFAAHNLDTNGFDGEGISEEQLEAVLASLTDRMGTEFNPPRSEDAFQLVSTQVIPVGGAVGAIFRYRDDQDRRVSLYIQPNWDREQRFQNVFERDNVAFQYRADDMLAYALAAPAGVEGLPGLETWLGIGD